MKKKDISRRGFLKGATALCVSGLTAASAWELWAAETQYPETEDLREKTMEAFADTVIPGPCSDPEGSMGGVEAGALEVLYDPYYGLRPFIGLLSRGLNTTSLLRYGRFYKDLDLSRRTAILLRKDSAPLMEVLYENAEMLVKLAFYGAVINDVGIHYISFPGPSHGYRDYSFGEKFSEEATEDGNLP